MAFGVIGILFVSATLFLAATHSSENPGPGFQDIDTHRSDRDLIDNFLAHRAEFKDLLGMVVHDRALYRVAADWTAPERPESVGITQDRIGAYRMLMKRLGIACGFSAKRVRGPKDFEFITSCEGNVARGSSKGYLYSERRPLDITDNLDAVIQAGLYSGCRHIEGSWYLFFERY